MKTVWKYDLPVRTVKDTFPIHKGGEVIYVACQRPEVVSFWVAIETNHNTEPRRFLVMGTGYLAPENAKYVGTAVDESFVWHLYEYIK